MLSDIYFSFYSPSYNFKGTFYEVSALLICVCELEASRAYNRALLVTNFKLKVRLLSFPTKLFFVYSFQKIHSNKHEFLN